MIRPRDAPQPYGQRGISLDPNRRHTRGGPPQGLRSGPNTTNRRMPDNDEGMDDLVDGFDSMGMDPRKHAAPGRPQGRRGPRRSDHMDAFDEEGIDPRRSSARGGPQDKAAMGHRRMNHIDDVGGRRGPRHSDDMDAFDEEGADPRRPPVGGGSQARAGMGPRRMNNMDDVGGDEFGAHGPSTRGMPQGRQGTGMGRRRMDNMDDLDEDEVCAPRLSTRGTPHGRRGTGSGYMDESGTDMVSYVPNGNGTGGSHAGASRMGAGDSRAGGEHGARLMADDGSHVPRGIRGTKPPTTSSVPSLRELEVELDKAEEAKRRADQFSKTAKKSDWDFANGCIEEAVHRSMKLKNEIYKLDPTSKRVDNTARFFLGLPPDLAHVNKGAPHHHRGHASRTGGHRGRRGARGDHY